VPLPPKNMVVMGQIIAPSGIQGAVKVRIYTELPDALLDYDMWWIGKDPNWQQVAVTEADLQGKFLIVRFKSHTERKTVEPFSGWEIGIPRNLLPQTDEDEFYWSDLIGLQVVNLQNETIGQVMELMETKAHDLLVVGDQKELIPFVDHIVKSVDLQAGKIVVDWDKLALK